jgi:hypothetical protein
MHGEVTVTDAATYAALAAFLGTLVGAGLTLAGTYVNARAEDRRQAREMELASAREARAYRDTAEQRVRETLVEISGAWSRVLQSIGPFRRGQIEARDGMVEALTQFGSKLDSLLVQPISTDLRDQAFETEHAIQNFRSSLASPSTDDEMTAGVSSALLEMFRIVRESEPLRSPPAH